jgi:hypothetical protein
MAIVSDEGLRLQYYASEYMGIMAIVSDGRSTTKVLRIRVHGKILRTERPTKIYYADDVREPAVLWYT